MEGNSEIRAEPETLKPGSAFNSAKKTRIVGSGSFVYFTIIFSV
jgi:hypothetical protein